MADGDAKAARNVFRLGAIGDNGLVSSGLISGRHGLAQQIFCEADFAKRCCFVIAHTHCDLVAFWQGARLNQRADRAPAAAAGVDSVFGFLGIGRGDDQRLQQAMLGDRCGKRCNAVVAVAFAHIGFRKDQLGEGDGGRDHVGYSRQARDPDHGSFNSQGASPPPHPSSPLFRGQRPRCSVLRP